MLLTRATCLPCVVCLFHCLVVCLFVYVSLLSSMVVAHAPAARECVLFVSVCALAPAARECELRVRARSCRGGARVHAQSLDKFRLPFAVVHGSIRALVVTVPWARLSSEAVRVELRGVVVVLDKVPQTMAEVRRSRGASACLFDYVSGLFVCVFVCLFLLRECCVLFVCCLFAARALCDRVARWAADGGQGSAREGRGARTRRAVPARRGGGETRGGETRGGEARGGEARGGWGGGE